MNIPMHVLVVDDDDDWTQELAERLREEGMSVRTASNVEDAFEICRWTRPDAVVLDIGLNHENGLDLVERLHDHGMFLTRVYIVSGNAVLEDAVRASRQDVAGFMLKPIDPDALIEKLEPSPGLYIAGTPQ